MNGREDGAQSSFRTISSLTAVPLLGMAVFFCWQWLNDGVTPREVARDVRAVTRTLGTPGIPPAVPAQQPSIAPVPPHEEALPRVRPKRRGDIVLIIDDLGFDGQPLDRVMSLDPNVNCAILPNATRAREYAERLHAAGFEILCHLPMQPRGRAAPGRNAILTSMSDDEIVRVTRDNLAAVPHARGVNNHMGSLATADRRVMTSVLGALPEGMYFVDSRTGGGSIAADVARELNIRTAARQVFLDDVITEAGVRARLAEVATTAEKRGVAIAIGHPHAVTLRVLAEQLPELRARGFRLVRASEVVE